LPTPQANCGNPGLQWALYPNPYTNSDNVYSSFSPTYFKTQKPSQNGTTQYVGDFTTGTTASNITVYNSTPFYSDYFTLDHRGYLFARQTGLYTFTVLRPDDIVFVWIGPFAYFGWSSLNPLLRVSYNTLATGTSATFSLVQGQYYPLRIMYANGQGAASLHFTITAPDGTSIASDSTAANPYFVQFSCGSLTLAPQYPAWGAET